MNLGKVLIIDDDRGIVDSLTTLLEDEGYKVSHTLNGRQGLDYLKSHGDIKLVLLDLMMPVMDGYLFREHQMKDSTMGAIPVIVLTAAAQDPLRLAAMKCDALLKKPIDIDSLLETVKTLMR